MPKFRYTDTVPRAFLGLSVEVHPGDDIDAETNPDPHFFEPIEEAPAAPVAAAEPGMPPASEQPPHAEEAPA